MSRSIPASVYPLLIVTLAVTILIFHVIQLRSFIISFDDVKKESGIVHTLFKTPKKASTNVLFFGDVMLGRNVEYLSDINGVSYSTERLSGRFSKHDAVVANFESAMAIPHQRTRAYTTQFSTAIRMLPVLTTLAVTHASLANNHTLDFGVSGYQNAINELEKSGIKSFGHSTQISSSSVTIIDGPQKIGVIAINTVFVTPDFDQLRLQIEAMKTNSDVQVAYIHWGEEYIAVHNEAQERLARILVSLGIDVIVGHHPHVVQDIQMIDGSLVFYSLGNFIFDQYFSDEVSEGFALSMSTHKDGQLSFSIIPVTSIDVRSQPRLMTEKEIGSFLLDLAERSDSTLRDAILQNNLRSVANLAPEGERSIIRQ